MGIHAALVGAALIPWMPAQMPRPEFNETSVALYTPSNFKLLLPPGIGKSGGGGGGGKREPRPASLGRLPRGADRQFVPPDPHPPENPKPILVMEPTIVAPQLAHLPQVNLLNIGDPNGVPSPPSSGPGEGAGIGNEGKGHGVGDDEGAGFDTGKEWGTGGDRPSIGGRGGVTAPTVVLRVDPEYSEDARKARYQGTVVLRAIVRKDGHVDVINVVRSLGYGLDQSAMEALKQWRFRPATQNGKPIDVPMNIEVTFNLR